MKINPLNVLKDRDASYIDVKAFDVFLYIAEYTILFGVLYVAIFIESFYIFPKEAGILVLGVWLLFGSCHTLLLPYLVYKDAKKLVLRGVKMENSPTTWASIVLMMPAYGLAFYLALKRADYKKQLSLLNKDNSLIN